MESFSSAETYCLVGSTLVFGITFSGIRFYRRFGRNTRYAVRTKFARWAVVGYVLISVVLSFLLGTILFSTLATTKNRWCHSIIIGLLSSGCLAGASAAIGVKSKDGQSLVALANWVYESIDPEIERLANEEVVAIVLRLTKHNGAREKLKNVAIYWISCHPSFPKPEKLFAQVEVYASQDVDMAKLVRLLLIDCRCDPEWLERMILTEQNV